MGATLALSIYLHSYRDPLGLSIRSVGESRTIEDAMWVVLALPGKAFVGPRMS